MDNDTIQTMQGSNVDVRSTALLVTLMDGTVDTRIRNNRVTGLPLLEHLCRASSCSGAACGRCSTQYLRWICICP